MERASAEMITPVPVVIESPSREIALPPVARAVERVMFSLELVVLILM